MRRTLFLLFGVMLVAGPAAADPFLVEDFSGEFPAWEKGWLGENSNLENYYGVGAGRGDNKDGLYLDDGDRLKYDPEVTILFDSAFGASLTQFSIDIAGAVPATFVIFDSAGKKLFSGDIGKGGYKNFSLKSDTGIGGFSFLSRDGNLEGKISIDNVKARVERPVRVAEPSSLILFGVGIAAVLVHGRRMRRPPSR